MLVRKGFLGLGGLVAMVLAGAVAVPLTAAPVDAVHARINGLRELGAAFKAVNDALRTGEPQTVLIQMSARQIVNASRAQYGWFPAGSGAEAGVKTAVKTDIWAQPARFKSAQDAFAGQALSFQKAAQSGNPDLIRAEAKKLGATCKGCHDQFRQDRT